MAAMRATEGELGFAKRGLCGSQCGVSSFTSSPLALTAALGACY